MVVVGSSPPKMGEGGSLSPPLCSRRNRRRRQPGCCMKPVAPVGRLFSWRSSPIIPGGASMMSGSSSPVTGQSEGSGAKNPVWLIQG